MAQYYYTLSSLPMLTYGMERPLPVEDFLAACRSELSERDFQVLAAAGREGGAEGAERAEPEVLRRWREWDAALRNELVRVRAPRKGLDAEKYLREAGFQIGPADAAREALAQETPLAAEDVLDRARWNYLGELESGHFFDLDRLIIYLLRLQLLHRKAAFDRQRGEAGFRDAYRKITRDIGNE